MEGRLTRRVLFFDVELHDRHGQRLYALCVPNDVITHKSQPWQLAIVLSAAQLCNLLGIDAAHIKRGVRAISHQFAYYRNIMGIETVSSHLTPNDLNPDLDPSTTEMMKNTVDGQHAELRQKALSNLKGKLQRLNARRKPMRYAHLKCVQTGNHRKRNAPNSKTQMMASNRDTKTLTVNFTYFYQKVEEALSDDRVQLIPIVSIVSKKALGKKKEKLEDFRFGVIYSSNTVLSTLSVYIFGFESILKNLNISYGVHGVIVFRTFNFVIVFVVYNVCGPL